MNPKNKKVWPMLELECIHCKETKLIPQRNEHRNNICSTCAAERQREYAKKKAKAEGKRSGIVGRVPYPLGEWEYVTQKFYAIQNKLNKCKSREERIEQIRKNLDAVLEDKEVMDWIWMHDKEERQKKADKRRKAKKSQKENIDTRNITWDEWEKLNFGQDWDD
jgi:hypothetical protein